MTNIRTILLLALMANSCVAADYYTDFATGNDSTGNGSSTAPWKTLQKGIDNSTGGDIINVANTAAEPVTGPVDWTNFGTTSVDLHLQITAWDNGGSLTLTTADGSTKTAAEFDGGGTAASVFNGAGAPKYVQLNGLKIHGCTSSGIGVSTYWWVDECEVYDCDGTYAVSVSALCEISRCYIHDCDAQGIYSASTLNRIIACRLENLTEIRAINVNQADTVVDSCIITNCVGQGILTSGDRTVITDNTIHGSGAPGESGIFVEGGSNELIAIHGNVVTGYSDATSAGILAQTGANLRTVGNNAFWDCASNYDVTASVTNDLRSTDIIETSVPYVSVANGDYSLAVNALSVNARVIGQNGSLGAIQQSAAGGNCPECPICPTPDPLTITVKNAAGTQVIDLGSSPATLTIEAE